MEAVSRYKRLINDIGAVFSLFLSYKNTDHTHYKQLVKNWGVGEVCSLLSEVEAFSVEELKHELYSLDGKPLKRFIGDLWCYLPDYNKELYCLAHDKEIFSLLEDIHGGKNAHLIIDNLIAIGITATKTKINRVALILDELQPQEQEQPPGEQCTAADKQPTALNLPQELETARRYFERAIDAKYMETTETGGKWLKTQAQLGYFCLKAFESPRPMAAIRKFFDYGDFSSAVTQGTYKPRRSDLKKWRAEQDKKIFFD